jgi:hypothetical protein
VKCAAGGHHVKVGEVDLFPFENGLDLLDAGNLVDDMVAVGDPAEGDRADPDDLDEPCTVTTADPQLDLLGRP